MSRLNSSLQTACEIAARTVETRAAVERILEGSLDVQNKAANEKVRTAVSKNRTEQQELCRRPSKNETRSNAVGWIGSGWLWPRSLARGRHGRPAKPGQPCLHLVSGLASSSSPSLTTAWTAVPPSVVFSERVSWQCCRHPALCTASSLAQALAHRHALARHPLLQACGAPAQSAVDRRCSLKACGRLKYAPTHAHTPGMSGTCSRACPACSPEHATCCCLTKALLKSPLLRELQHFNTVIWKQVATVHPSGQHCYSLPDTVAAQAGARPACGGALAWRPGRRR